MPRSFKLWIERIKSSRCLQYPRQKQTKFHASNESIKKHILIYESIEVGLKYSLNLILISELNYCMHFLVFSKIIVFPGVDQI